MWSGDGALCNNVYFCVLAFVCWLLVFFLSLGSKPWFMTCHIFITEHNKKNFCFFTTDVGFFFFFLVAYANQFMVYYIMTIYLYYFIYLEYIIAVCLKVVESCQQQQQKKVLVEEVIFFPRWWLMFTHTCFSQKNISISSWSIEWNRNDESNQNI